MVAMGGGTQCVVTSGLTDIQQLSVGILDSVTLLVVRYNHLSTFKKISYQFYSALDSTSGRFGKGTGPILMDFVNCTGSEPRLYPDYNSVQGCRYYTHYYGCSHDDDVGVKCELGIIIKIGLYRDYNV